MVKTEGYDQTIVSAEPVELGGDDILCGTWLLRG